MSLFLYFSLYVIVCVAFLIMRYTVLCCSVLRCDVNVIVIKYVVRSCCAILLLLCLL